MKVNGMAYVGKMVIPEHNNLIHFFSLTAAREVIER